MLCRDKICAVGLALGFVLTVPITHINGNIADKRVKITPVIEKKKVIKKVETVPVQSSNVKVNNINLVCTFYTSAKDETGSGLGITASGVPVTEGMIASNNFKFGTKIYIQALGRTYTVTDTGNPNYIKQLDSNTYRIDVYVPTKQQALELGVIKSIGYVIK